MAPKPKRSKRGRGRNWSGYLLSFALGALLVFLGYSFFSHFLKERTHRPGISSRKASPAEKTTPGRSHDVGTSKKDTTLPPRSGKQEEAQTSPSGATGRPKIAFVIDDLGGENHLSRELLRFDFPLTFSILPFRTYSKRLATEAPQNGKEAILHLPMEPHGYPKVKPGEGALLEKMNEEKLLWQLSRDIDSVPNIKGVSNHMGSRLMEDPEKLKKIFSELKRRGLFFLDSRTTPQTVGLETARLVGLRAMERTLFIDNSLEEHAIKESLDRLVRSSLSTGIAIGIGHPHAATIQSIREMVPEIRQKGIEIVPLSVLFSESPNSTGPQ
jgi:uncharacterized protein